MAFISRSTRNWLAIASDLWAILRRIKSSYYSASTYSLEERLCNSKIKVTNICYNKFKVRQLIYEVINE